MADEDIASFTSITGASDDRARFFLESSNGDVSAAVEAFYDSGGVEGTSSEAQDDTQEAATSSSATPSQSVPATASQAPAASSTGPRTLGGSAAEPLPQGWGSRAATGSSARSRGGGFSAGGGRGGIATLGDINRRDAEEDEDDEDRPANLFAGGERSALSVQNPDFRRDEGGHSDAVREILKQAAQGARNAQEPTAAGSLAGSAGPSSFMGRGRTIGGAEEPAASAQQSGSSAGARGGRGQALPGGFGDEDEEEGEEEEPVAVRHLTFWQDGFSIERGPLHRYDDPATQPLLDAIRTQRAPLALFDLKFGQRVEIRVAHRMQEKFSPQLAETVVETAPPKPFGGQGNRLGSPAPTLGGSSAASASGSAPSATTTSASSATGAGAGAGGVTPANFQVDSSQPTTQIQVRLADGSRLVGRFNHTHTVADLRSYIDSSQSGMAARSYVLQASFPPKPITDETQTIKEAGLISSVVIQKWT